MIDFSLVIACYHDADHLFNNVMALHHYLVRTRFTYELIFVEDASRDHTAAEVRRCIKQLDALGVQNKAIFHQTNVGRGGSVSEGMVAASGHVVGYIDIDLEHMMDGIQPMLTSIIDDNNDVVVGHRVVANPWAKPLRALSSFSYRFLVHRFIQIPLHDTEVGLKLFRREAILPILHETHNKAWFWDTEILHRAYINGLRLAEHRIIFIENRAKKSTVRLIPDTYAYLLALRDHLALLAAEKSQRERSSADTSPKTSKLLTLEKTL